MSKLTKRSATAKPEALKGWQQIAKFLGQPVATAQRWAKSGMPVARQGRYVTAVPEDLNRWYLENAALNQFTSQPTHAIFPLISNVASHMYARSEAHAK
jgi:hypothetical protein